MGIVRKPTGQSLPQGDRERELIAALVGEAAAGLGGHVLELGASYGFSADLVTVCGSEVLLVAGDIDPAHARQAVGLLRTELARLASGTGLEALFSAAQQQVTYQLLEESGDTQEIAANLLFAAEHRLSPNSSRDSCRGS